MERIDLVLKRQTRLFGGSKRSDSPLEANSKFAKRKGMTPFDYQRSAGAQEKRTADRVVRVTDRNGNII